MKTIKISAYLLVISAFCLNVFGQPQNVNESKTPSAKTSNYFPLAELKAGMKGTARTVFRGTEPEEYQVEILGVVPGAVGPKQDMIVGRISGGSADRTSVFAGMSGSPVYIDGRLVGAIAYSFPFAKEPICGITPISQMLSIFEQNQNIKIKSKEPRAVSFAELASTDWRTNFPNSRRISSSFAANANSGSALNAIAGQTFQPIATPVAFNGFSQETLNQFTPQLLSAGLFPVSAVGGATSISSLKTANETTLQGGAAVSMALVRGDASMAASGTVRCATAKKSTLRSSVFSLGTSDLPMSESSVVTVIPNVNNSFVIAVPNQWSAR
jgi:hypothetical protein